MGEFSRRHALRIAGSAAGTLPLVGQAVADEGDSKKSYLGISYSTLTQEFQREGACSLNFNPNSVEGRIKVGGFNIPIRKADSVRSPHGSRDHDKYIVVKNQPEFVHEGSPLKIRINNFRQNINGTISRPGPYGKLGFTMVPNGQNKSEKVRNGLPQRGKGEKYAVPQTVPTNGLPEYISLADQWTWANNERASEAGRNG